MSQEDLLREYRSLCDQIAYHNRKYYVEDAPEIDDFEYDRLYRRLETMEAEHPELVTPDSPTQKVGASALNTFAPVTHEVPMESLHDSFSEEELLDFDRRVRETRSRVWWSRSLTASPFLSNTGTAFSCAVPHGATASWAKTSRRTCA